MESKAFNITNLVRLSGVTECTDKLLAALMTEKIIGSSDISRVMSKSELIDRSRELWEILMKQPVTLKQLKDVFYTTGQTEVCFILDEDIMLLNNRPVRVPQSGMNGLANSPTSRKNLHWKLHFARGVKISDVLRQLQPLLAAQLKHDGSNTMIAIDIMSLEYINRRDMMKIVSDITSKQINRMNAMFTLISTLNDGQILCCLERLCNLKDLPSKSEQIRKIFNEQFPGSLLLS